MIKFQNDPLELILGICLLINLIVSGFLLVFILIQTIGG